MSAGEMALRISCGWAITMAAIIWMSAYGATRKAGDINLAVGCLFAPLPAFNAGFAILYSYPLLLFLRPPGGPAVAAVIFVTLAAGLMWANAILIQLLQNAAYRAIGVKTQPIRWVNGYQPKRRRRPPN